MKQLTDVTLVVVSTEDVEAAVAALDYCISLTAPCFQLSGKEPARAGSGNVLVDQSARILDRAGCGAVRFAFHPISAGLRAP
jgi:hypothetical protein